MSAENANGESPLSGEALTTPTDLVLPTPPLPTVDSFDRANENPLSDAGRWTNGINGSETGLNTTSNALACSKSTTCTAWRNNAQYGPDVEVWTKVSTLPGTNNAVRLLGRLKEVGTSTYDGYMLRTSQLAGTDQVFLERVDNGAVITRLTMNQELAVGDILLLRVKGSTLEAWRNDGTSWSRLGVVTDTTYAAGGYAGVGIRGTSGRVDDFGARSLSQNAPGAPTALSAQAGSGSVGLSWTAPGFDGGSPVTNYRVYRGASAGAEVFLANAGAMTRSPTGVPPTGRPTTTRSPRRTRTARARSRTRCPRPDQRRPARRPASHSRRLQPSERAPLSDAGRWTNGVSGVGGVETGLNTSSNVLACSKTTTCTAWRNNAQYGQTSRCGRQSRRCPATNNHVRLYARLEGRRHLRCTTGTCCAPISSPEPTRSSSSGSTTARTSPGFSRSTTACSRRHPAPARQRLHPRDLAPQRQLPLVATRRRGVTRRTPAPGFVGVGIRGTTGRLDDFGARPMGAPPPTAPTAPQNLQASAGNAQVVLTWGAPASDGGSQVTSYKVYRSTSTGTETLLPTSAITGTRTLDTDSDRGQRHHLLLQGARGERDRRRPTLERGLGDADPPPTDQHLLPPQNLQASAGNAQVVLTWGAPASDGGSQVNELQGVPLDEHGNRDAAAHERDHGHPDLRHRQRPRPTAPPTTTRCSRRTRSAKAHSRTRPRRRRQRLPPSGPADPPTGRPGNAQVVLELGGARL